MNGRVENHRDRDAKGMKVNEIGILSPSQVTAQIKSNTPVPARLPACLT